MSKGSRSLVFFLSGVVTGAALGLVFAPEEGKAVRDKLSYRLSKYRLELEKLIQSFLDEKEGLESTAKVEGEKVVNEAREKAEKLLEDVDRLMEQIKNQSV